MFFNISAATELQMPPSRIAAKHWYATVDKSYSAFGKGEFVGSPLKLPTIQSPLFIDRTPSGCPVIPGSLFFFKLEYE
jgi:hypothetical protein